MQFEDFGLIEPLLKAVRFEGYTTPTPIQQRAIPHVLDGKDVLGCAQTGTGKTAAFSLPILQRFHEHPYEGKNTRPIRCLILSPTRELAAQIHDSFVAYGKHTSVRQTVAYGGVNKPPQIRAVKKGVDVLIATPGRLLDLMEMRVVDLSQVEVFVLDEADRMLDMGFIPDVRRIVSRIPTERQTLLFSATMPQTVMCLANWLQRDPVDIRVTPDVSAAETVEHIVYFVAQRHKAPLLQHLLQDDAIGRALVFTRTKHGAERLAHTLSTADINADSIHADKPQKAREKALDDFKNGRTRVLVASDIAARGIDVDDITHVINFDMPQDAETYVHRIGRTGRAGQSGLALSFCDVEERRQLAGVESMLERQIQAIADHPFCTTMPNRDPDAQRRQRANRWARMDKRARRRGR